MKSSNWPGGIDYSHSNFTRKFPRVSRYDGMGAWAKDSTKIPFAAVIGAIATVAVAGVVLFVGAAVGF